MKKQYVIVTNTGKRVRDRLGSRFLPNESQTLYVNSRQYLTLKAVKDFEVSIAKDEHAKLDEDTAEQLITSEHKESDKKEDEAEQERSSQDIQELQEKLNESNVDQVIEMVANNELTVDEAIAYETVGKNRTTLLDKLEELKQGE